jgi:hypothetical protein
MYRMNSSISTVYIILTEEAIMFCDHQHSYSDGLGGP